MPRTEDNEEVIGTVPFNSFNFQRCSPSWFPKPKDSAFPTKEHDSGISKIEKRLWAACTITVVARRKVMKGW